MKCIEEAVALAVVRQRSGEHRSARHPVVVSASRIRHNLVGRALVPQPNDRIVLCVRSQVQRCRASLYISSRERVPISCRKVDSISPADRASAACRAIDVQAHERAGIQPVRRCRIRYLMSNRVDRRPKPVERVVEKRPSGVVSCPVQRHARLILIPQEIQAFQIHLLRAISHKSLCCRGARSCRVDHHVIQVKAHRIRRIGRVAHLHHRARPRIHKHSPAQTPTCIARAPQCASAQGHIPRPSRDNHLIGRRNGRAGQLHSYIRCRYRQVRSHRQSPGKVTRVAGSSITRTYRPKTRL